MSKHILKAPPSIKVISAINVLSNFGMQEVVLASSSAFAEDTTCHDTLDA